MNNVIFTSAIFSLSIVGAEPALAGGHTFGEFIDNTRRVITPPTTRVIEDVIQGKKPEDAVKDVISEESNKVQEATSFLSSVNAEKLDIIRNIAGDDVANIVGWGDAPRIFAYNTAAATAGAIEAVLVDGKPVDVVLGVPLASALRQAHEYYDSRAKPIPEDVKKLMALTFTQDTLNSARYVVSSLEANLPAIINTLRADFGEFRAVKYDKAGNEISEKKVHAVVVGDIIVFSDEVSSAEIFFWGHELQHVVQYAQMGFEEFAAKYQSDYKGIEAEADAVGKKAVEDAEIVMKVLVALNQ